MITQVDIDDYGAKSPKTAKAMGMLLLILGIAAFVGAFLLSEYFQTDACTAIWIGALFIAYSTAMKNKEAAIQMAIRLKTH